MRGLKIRSLALLVTIALLLCGCAQSSQVEDQAYVLVMGLDRSEDGKIQMTVQIPQISGNGDAPDSGGKESAYKQFCITAESYESALEKLSWAATRKPDLAQMKLLVISRALAQEPDFRRLIENIAQTERLYTATRVAICEGKAKDFVEAIQPYIGTRISTDVDALFEHYAAEGYLPESRLADLYYQTESIYSDPLTAYALLDARALQQQAAPASAMRGSVNAISEDLESDQPTRYLGAAVFRDGCMRGVLNARQTIIANLLRNQIKSLRYECGGQSLTIVPARSVRLRVNAKADPAQLIVDARLSIGAQEEKPDEALLRASLEADIRNTIEAARSMGAEPFGFAEKAAMSFPNFDAWQKYGWRERFQTAEIEIKLRFAYSDT